MRQVFLGYPFRLVQIREAVIAACEGVATVICADDTLTGVHLLDKIEQMMVDADLCLFDLTTHNVNVATEYGMARTLRLEPLILYNESEEFKLDSAVHDVFSDLRGIDSVRYTAYDELTTILRSRIGDVLDARAHRKAEAMRLKEEREREQQIEVRPYLRATAEILDVESARRAGKETSAFQIMVRITNAGRGVAESVKVTWAATSRVSGGQIELGPLGAGATVQDFIMAGWAYGQPVDVPTPIIVRYTGSGWIGETSLVHAAGTNPPKWSLGSTAAPTRE